MASSIARAERSPCRAGHFYSGTISALTVTAARVSITPRLSFDPGVTINRIALPQGTFTTKLLSARVDYAFTPRMFASGFLQYNSDTQRFSSNIRYRWEYKPGSEVFLVYTDERDTPRVSAFHPSGTAHSYSRSTGC